ncbi:MAG: glycosyltransferase family 39 protein [Planctomycetaceae bacterium]
MSNSLLTRLSQASWRADAIVIGLIAVGYLLVWPVGQYAILDDWAYVKSLEHLHNDGQLKILDWNPMSLVGHLFWGVLFTKAAGFSFTVTKLSVVVMHVVECLVLLHFLRRCGTTEGVALAAVGALALQPLHFVHCHMFMTDVPAIAWQLVVLYCAIRALESSGRAELGWFALGSVFSGVGFLVRQGNVCVPAALLVYLVVFDRERLWRRAVLLAAFAPAAAIAGAFEYWYMKVHGPTQSFEMSMQQTREFLLLFPPDDVLYILLTFAIYLGLAVAPLALAAAPRNYRLASPTRNALFGVSAAAFVATLAYYTLDWGRTFPYIRNVVTPLGYFEANEFVLGPRDTLWGPTVGGAISVLCAVSFILFLNSALCRDAPTRPVDTRRRALRLVSLLLGLQIVYLLLTAPILFDRHLLSLFPTAIIVFCLLFRQEARLIPLTYAACLVPFAWYSVAGSHDVHALSREAFFAGRDLISAGVSPEHINAGYAFDCWYKYEDRADRIEAQAMPIWWLKIDPNFMRYERRTDTLVRWREEEWWVGPIRPSLETQYAVLTRVEPLDELLKQGWRIESERKYRTWWPWRVASLYVVKSP